MATRHTSRRRSSVKRTNVASRTTVLHVGSNASGDRLVQAANKMADGIRDVSRTFSRKIPESIDVRPAGAELVFVVATAPNADPIENGKRHPLFAQGPRPASNNDPAAKGTGWDHWYQMKKIPFMEMGVKASIDDAATIYGKTVDDWLHEVGWE